VTRAYARNQPNLDAKKPTTQHLGGREIPFQCIPLPEVEVFRQPKKGEKGHSIESRSAATKKAAQEARKTAWKNRATHNL